ncbi:hypothetical protein Ccrd_022979, partial [Cynara cardunculus var. scolymus]
LASKATFLAYSTSEATIHHPEKSVLITNYEDAINVCGTTPVVGAPIIQYFAPSPGSILHVKELTDVELVVKTMKQLAENLMAYNESLRQCIGNDLSGHDRGYYFTDASQFKEIFQHLTGQTPNFRVYSHPATSAATAATEANIYCYGHSHASPQVGIDSYSWEELA